MKGKIFIILFIIISLALWLNLGRTAKKKFTGEVYKVNKYTKTIVCRGRDLSMIETGQLLYICDENNKYIATVRIIRYYTTLIDTKLVKGNIRKIKAGMIVYSHKSQFKRKRKIRSVKYKKEYNYYWWEVAVIYKVENKRYKRKTKIMLPKIIELLAKGSDEEVKIAPEEIEYLGVSDEKFSSIKLKDGSKADLEWISIPFPAHRIPEDEWTEKRSRLIKKRINLSKENVTMIKILKRKEGLEVLERTYGGSNDDSAYSIQQTRDGGYIVAGGTASKGNGEWDIWVLKLNEIGKLEWERTYGGSDSDGAYSIQQTKDSGYIVTGCTESKGAGGDDIWVLKLNEIGKLEWERIYGGSNDDFAYSIQQTKDGGYIVAGYTASKGAGAKDIWILKLNGKGKLKWEKIYGGWTNDSAFSIQQTEDGGYVIAGFTRSKGTGSDDIWILKLDARGELKWERTYGGSDSDAALSIQQTRDGGYIVAGGTASKGNGEWDIWVLKLNEIGKLKWERTYGGWTSDYVFSIQQTKDGGYIVAGCTESKGAGGDDIWVLKLNEIGKLEWERTYGGSDNDCGFSIQQTRDNGYIIAGYTESKGAGGRDVWVLKLDRNGNVIIK